MALISEPSATACLAPDELLIAKHQSKIDKVVTEIEDAIAQEDYLENGSRYSGILQAKQEQFEELENQLRAYKMVMGRTIDPQQGNRESYRFSGRLPAFGKRIEIDGFVDHFDSSNRFLIVQGQTGSGKSTQLPQYIADHPRMSGKKIICTQPRKIAATSLADRVAFEYACGKKSRAGPEVGYSVGGSKPLVEEKTKIIFMTEGRMLERVINRRESDFKNIGAIIIDEAHERSITCDILLGVLKKADPLWKDILLVVASATIDLAVFEKFFDHRATLIEIAGRMYPVQRIYKPLSEGGCILSEQDEIVKAVGQIAMDIHTSKNAKRGDILCFLPSAEEVHRTADWFEKNLKKNKEFVTAKIYELSGRQDADEQRNVFEKLDPKKYRKVIFASPIAETSITINGVVYVVDSGVKKEMSFDPKRNISSLKIVDISQSSSLQREGRAGRTQPGVCYKLYTEEDFRNMTVNSLPEIFRRPLPLSILFLRKMGVDPVGFDWVSSPEPEAIRKAETELILLGAIDADNKKPTTLGELISHSQQDPKIVRMIYNGMLKGYGMVAIKLATLLSVSSYFFFNGGKEADVETKAHHFEKRKSLQHEDGDILTLLRVYTAYESLGHVQVDAKEKKRIKMDWIKDNSLRGKAIRTAESTVGDLKYIFYNTAEWNKRAQDLIPTEEEVLRLFCSGYFLHAARRVNVKVYGRNRLSYFAIEPEVVGSLPYSASLKQTSNDGDNEIPEWIIFDQILKFSEKTIFPGSSRIDFSWIQKESNEFYLTCNLKERKLPTEVVEIEAADTVLKTIFGKRLINLPRLEYKLDCSIIADLSDGFLRGLCTRTSRSAVENSLREEVGRAREVLKRETMEFTWRGNTRLVITSGYEVLSILFPREFNTIGIYNLHQDSTLQELEETVYSKMDDRQKISGIRFFRLERSCMGIIKLFNPSDAAILLNELKEEMNDESGISVAPHMGDDSTGTIPKGEEVKLKISWPLGYSTGEATVIVETARDGNKIVDRISEYFYGAFANALGDVHLTDFACQKPRYIKLRGRPFRFCEDIVYEVEPIYKVKIKKLFSGVDEFQIIEQLKRFNVTPLRVFVHRKDFPQYREKIKSKEENLSPFRSSPIGSDEEVMITNFLDKAACRGGVFVYHPDKMAVENVYHELEEKYRRMTAFNQPYRVELDRTFTFSVHMDLYRCLRPKFKETLFSIKKLNVFVIETGPGTGYRKNQEMEKKMTFVYITLRHSDASVIRRCRRMLEAILEKESLTPETSPNIENLFTWSGRVLLKERIPTSHDHYIHWDNWNRSVYVYGMEPETRNEIIAKLNSLIDLVETWKTAGFFEEAVNLDRKALEDLEKTNPNFIDSLCKTLEIERGQYHLIGRSKLLISAASAEEFEKFRKALDAKGLRFSGERKKPAVGRDCVVCFCEVDSDFKITSICSHAFCVGCIQNMFTGAAGVQKLPLCCPADQCELRLPIQDVMKILPARFKSKLNESALDVYLRSEKGSGVRYCPKPGCNQIFRPKTGEGPTYYACDNCLADFCLECTEAMGKEVGAHPGQSCDSVRLGEDDKVWKNMNRIRDEVLNLRCPKCKAAFYDYEGCVALTCSTCRAAICGICLEYCGSDAHGHVTTCRYNPSGTYYHKPDSNTVKKGNKQYRIDKLKEFFRITPGLDDPPDLKAKILTALASDLKDLDIQTTDILP